MRIEDIREKSNEELEQELTELKEELFRLRFRHATHQLENPSQLRSVRRNIARVKTVQSERELQAARQA